MNDDKVSIRKTLFTKETANLRKQPWRLPKWELLNTSLEICCCANLLNTYVHKMRRSITIAVTTVHHSTVTKHWAWVASIPVCYSGGLGFYFRPRYQLFCRPLSCFPLSYRKMLESM